MKAITVYYTNGTPNEDLNSPSAPYQGLTLSKYLKDDKGNWLSVMRSTSGEPNFGYLPVEVNAEMAAIWQNRIDKVKAARGGGYQDAENLWYQGEVPNSLLTAAAYQKRRDKAEHSYLAREGKLRIDQLADSILVAASVRSEEYEERYKEAIYYLENPTDEKKEYPYLSTMTTNGLSLLEAATVVKEKYEQAKANLVEIARLRMQKNMMGLDIGLLQKRTIFNQTMDALNVIKKQ